ncbi:MAG: hypothetical protein OER43_08775 [Gammaproteobacteria bacterium]|nr:hypothetical protein [Gammaproteobacteria bacterium]
MKQKNQRRGSNHVVKAGVVSATLLLLGALSPPAWSESEPQLQIDKEIVGGASVAFGSDVTFKITVTNSGVVSLDNVLVRDEAAPDCGGYLVSRGGPNPLDPGASFSYECKALNVQEGFSNRATAIGDFEKFGDFEINSQCVVGKAERRSQSVNVMVTQKPMIDIRKQEEGNDSRTVTAGSDVDFEIVVTNTGDLALTDVKVIDPLAPDCEAMIGDLGPGESKTYICTRPNVTNGFRNTATAIGRAVLVGGDTAGCEVSDEDPSRVNIQEFECAVMVSKQADPETIIPTPPPSCETLGGKPSSLTFKFTGGGCAASDNDQGTKSVCSGSVNTGMAATVTAGNKDLTKLYGVVGSPVLLGDSFTVTGPFDSDSGIELSNGGGTEFNRIHTSCSQPLAAGDVFGSLTLVGINGVGVGSGEVTYTYTVTNQGDPAKVTLVDDKLGPIPAPGQNVIDLASGEVASFSIITEILATTTNIVTANATLNGNPELMCSAQASTTVTVEDPPKSCADGKPTALVFEYTGQSCGASNNNQGGKTDCSGDPAGASPVRVVMTKDANEITVTPNGETLGIGGLVTISDNDGNKFASEIKFDVEQGGSVLQSLAVHTSCSAPLNVGDQFGSLILREFVPEP